MLEYGILEYDGEYKVRRKRKTLSIEKHLKLGIEKSEVYK